MLPFTLKITDRSFSTFAKICKKLTFHTPWYAHIRVQGIRNAENIANVLNEWFMTFILHFSLVEDLEAVNLEKTSKWANGVNFRTKNWVFILPIFTSNSGKTKLNFKERAEIYVRLKGKKKQTHVIFFSDFSHFERFELNCINYLY